MFPKTHLWTAAFVIAATLTSPAFAQEAAIEQPAAQEQIAAEQQQAEQAPTEEAAPAVAYSDEKLEAFVDTLIAITSLQQGFAQQLQTATTEDEKAKIIQDLENQIVSLIKEKNDMTVEEFEAMSIQAQQDQEMTNKIRMILTQKVGQPQ